MYIERGKYAEFDEDMYMRYVFEFYGCFYHGHSCLKQANPDSAHPLRKGYTYADVRQETQDRQDAICKYFEKKNLNYKLITEWECCLNDQLTGNRQDGYNDKMKKYFDQCEDTAPFSPRKCLYGGREFFKNSQKNF